MPRGAAISLVVLLAGGPVAGCSAGSTTAVTGRAGRTVDITLSEMRFTPSRLRVKVGEIVTFHLTNKGTVRHEAVFGNQQAQDQAMAMMQAMDPSMTSTPGPATTLAPMGGRARPAMAHPGMSMPNVISLDPGRSGDLTFTFGEVAHLFIQCHEAGHLQAGMTADLIVVAAER